MPEVEKTLTGYTFEWVSEKVLVKVSRVRAHTDGKITGEVKLVLGKDKQEEPSFSWNFSSAQTRKQLVNLLSEKYPEWKDNWLGIIDELCRQVQDLVKAGEPVVTLHSTDGYEELEYLIYPLIPLGKPTAIFGDPGSGKSQLAVIIIIIAGLPWADNTLNLGAPSKPSKILYLDYEADSDDVKRQLVQLVDGMELGYCGIEYRRCLIPLTDDIESIQNIIEERQIDGVIVDSVSLAAGGDLNRMDVATEYVRALRSLGSGLTTISFAHTSKDRDAKSKTIIGSVLFEAGFRSVWEIRGNSQDDSLEVALFHRKVNLSKRFDNIGFEFRYNGTGITVSSHDPKSVPEFLERMSARQQILEKLKEEQLNNKELSEALDITLATIYKTTSRMSSGNHKVIVKLSDVKDAKWGLASTRLEM